jgi:aminobenzoyl-glutamate utilization protein B
MLLWLYFNPVTSAVASEKHKRAAEQSVDRQANDLIDLSQKIWQYAEVALEEYKSSKALADYAQAQGFTVERGVAGMPTAFVATYGSGKPVIGILGEYDALPGISQKAVPRKEPLERGAAGHGCGHNLFGAGSLGAAVAIKELIEAGALTGTIRFYGCPAEERIGGKLYMAREGLFEDLDVCLAWHPSDKTQADVTSSQAMVDFIVEFHGRTAHAAADPWNGRSAVDGAELFTDGINMLREHVKPSVRMHYTIVKGGDVPNVVPDYARVWCWVRDWTRDGVEDVFSRVKDIAKGAALMAGVESELTVMSGSYELLVNTTGAESLQRNLERLGPIRFTEDEMNFAKAIQRAANVPENGLQGGIVRLEDQQREGGSTDVGDVSWLVPTLHVSVATAPLDAPWHAWPVVSCSGMSIGHKGMLHAAKVLATTMVDLFEDPQLRQEIRQEFEAQTEGKTYRAYIRPGPPPLPKR